MREYRRETLRYDLDDLTQAGYAFYNAIPSFTAPAFEVKEAFGEIRVPLLKDMPLIKELTLSGSGRISDYKGVDRHGLRLCRRCRLAAVRATSRLRGSYARSVRAPNLSELYLGAGPELRSGSVRSLLGT